jgi:hypothetical protein
MSLIVTLPITTENRVQIFQGSHGKYYHIEDDDDDEDSKLFPLNYDIHFPLDWVMDEKYYYENYFTKSNNSTGPIYCNDCKDYGFYNGVFIGYCNNCAEKFDYKRGNGFIICPHVEPAKECTKYLMLKLDNDDDDGDFEILSRQKENSIWDTYLKGISFNEIGDTTLAEERELYKDMPPLISYSDSDEDNKNENEENINVFKNFDYNNYILEHELSKEDK